MFDSLFSYDFSFQSLHQSVTVMFVRIKCYNSCHNAYSFLQQFAALKVRLLMLDYIQHQCTRFHKIISSEPKRVETRSEFIPKGAKSPEGKSILNRFLRFRLRSATPRQVGLLCSPSVEMTAA